MGLANDRTGLVMWKIILRAWKDVVNCQKKKKANKPKLMKKLTVIIYKTNKKKQ